MSGFRHDEACSDAPALSPVVEAASSRFSCRAHNAITRQGCRVYIARIRIWLDFSGCENGPHWAGR